MDSITCYAMTPIRRCIVLTTARPAYLQNVTISSFTTKLQDFKFSLKTRLGGKRKRPLSHLGRYIRRLLRHYVSRQIAEKAYKANDRAMKLNTVTGQKHRKLYQPRCTFVGGIYG